MGYKHESATFNCKAVSGTAKLVLWSLAHRARQKDADEPAMVCGKQVVMKVGYCFPSVSTIAKDHGMSVRTAIRGIKKCIKAKLVTLLTKGGLKEDARASNLYYVNLQAILDSADSQSPDTDTSDVDSVITDIKLHDEASVVETKPEPTTVVKPAPIPSPSTEHNAVVQLFYKTLGTAPIKGDDALIRPLIDQHGQTRVLEVLTYNMKKGYWAGKLRTINFVVNKWDKLASTYESNYEANTPRKTAFCSKSSDADLPEARKEKYSIASRRESLTEKMKRMELGLKEQAQ